MNDDLATRLADFLENIATKVRSMTVDRASKAITIAAGVIVAGALVTVALVYLIVGVFRAASVPLTVEGAYAVFGGLFVLGGALVWWKRNPKDDHD